MASLGGIDAYMEQWLKTATKGNVHFTMAFLTNRMHLHCDVCNIGLTCEKPVNAQTIDFAVQEYVKLHAHKGGFGDEWKCEMCGVWTKEPLTGPSGHGTTCKALVTNPDQQVPTVVNHVPPPRPSAPVNDVFEDKGRKFR